MEENPYAICLRSCLQSKACHFVFSVRVERQSSIMSLTEIIDPKNPMNGAHETRDPSSYLADMLCVFHQHLRLLCSFSSRGASLLSIGQARSCPKLCLSKPCPSLAQEDPCATGVERNGPDLQWPPWVQALHQAHRMGSISMSFSKTWTDSRSSQKSRGRCYNPTSHQATKTGTSLIKISDCSEQNIKKQMEAWTTSKKMYTPNSKTWLMSRVTLAIESAPWKWRLRSSWRSSILNKSSPASQSNMFKWLLLKPHCIFVYVYYSWNHWLAHKSKNFECSGLLLSVLKHPVAYLPIIN